MINTENRGLISILPLIYKQRVGIDAAWPLSALVSSAHTLPSTRFCHITRVTRSLSTCLKHEPHFDPWNSSTTIMCEARSRSDSCSLIRLNYKDTTCWSGQHLGLSRTRANKIHSNLDEMQQPCTKWRKICKNFFHFSIYYRLHCCIVISWVMIVKK